jgi:DNA-binding XRE family transcriptional regulator
MDDDELDLNDSNIKLIMDEIAEAKRLRQETARAPRFHESSAIIAALIQARNRHGLSQEELAKILGWKRGVLARFETGKHSPKLTTLLEVAAALNYQIMLVPGPEPQEV